MKKLMVNLMAKDKIAPVMIFTFVSENFLTVSYFASIGPYLQTVLRNALVIFGSYRRSNPSTTTYN